MTVRDGFDHIDVKTVPELVGQQIEEAIHLGLYGPGDKLPAEQQLADHLGVSRMTVRYALQILQTKGYVRSKRGKTGGWFINNVTPSTNPLRESLLRSLPRLYHVLDFRLVVEPAAAQWAAERRTEDHLAQMEGALALMENVEDLPEFRRADSAFHLAIAAATGNPMMEKAIREARMTLFVLADAMGFGVVLHSTREEHRRIYRAIREGEGDEAYRAMAHHIETTRSELNDILDKVHHHKGE